MSDLRGLIGGWRTFCDTLTDMRDVLKIAQEPPYTQETMALFFKHIAMLIEELQMHGNRMETGLATYREALSDETLFKIQDTLADLKNEKKKLLAELATLRFDNIEDFEL